MLVSTQAALQEAFFLGLRLNRGVDLKEAERNFGAEAAADYSETISELVSSKLLEGEGTIIRLTRQGRLLSNEVFEKFISVESAADIAP
jgi:oxygen-independent coproporphyrinogen-3 oxidase